MNGASILGSGAYIATNKIGNRELEEMLALEPGFIEQRTGMKERRWSSSIETTEYMASWASRCAVEDSGVKKIDKMIIVRDGITTSRWKSLCLPVKKYLSGRGIDVEGCDSIDTVQGCKGFADGVNIAQLLVRDNQADNVLVFSSTDYTDLIETDREFNVRMGDVFDAKDKDIRKCSVPALFQQYQSPALNGFLWGCGAGAVVVGKTDTNRIIGARSISNLGHPYNSVGIAESTTGKNMIYMAGRGIYSFAKEELPGFITDTLGKFGLSINQINVFVMHQPQPRMVRELREGLGLPEEKMPITCDYLGNSIGATVPITFHQLREAGKIKSGDIIFMGSFGDQYLGASAVIFTEK